MNNPVFWDTTPCVPIETKVRHLLDTLDFGSLLGSFFDPEDGGNGPPKRQFIFKEIHCVVP
jgi:hypothetical protein